MKLSLVHGSSAAAILFLALLMSSFNHGHLAAEETKSSSHPLRVTVSPTTGDYAIGQPGAASDVLTAGVAAKVGGRWLHARDYPEHSVTESDANDDLGTAHEWTIRHSGLADAPEI